MTKARAFRIARDTLDVNHRHMVFTIDERLRPYFKSHPDWLHFLFDAAKEAIFYAFNKEKANTNKKLSSRKKKRKRNKNKITPGFIITLHTYGRDLKWNPHVHYDKQVLMTSNLI
jgi:hypothetical protein